MWKDERLKRVSFAYPRTNGSPARSAINRATLFGR
jgi:hypothetical protein